MFYFEKIDNKKILKSDLIKYLSHAFTTKETFIKSGEIDAHKIINKNKSLIYEYFSISEENLISPTQTHSSNIEIAEVGRTKYDNTDAIILTNSKQAVFLNFADCTPIILFDELNNIAAIVHAGWRGTSGKIVQKTIKKMVKNFDSQPKNILAAIGPAIGSCCYDIGEDVYKELKSTVQNSDNCFIIKDNKIFADLKRINYQQLLACGVKKIDLCNYCTSCTNELFFSYRKENGTTNRHSAIIKLNER